MMSSLDALLAPGFPHATPRGYKLGCRGSACSGIAEVGWSCREAWTRYNGEFTYRRRVDAGLKPLEIRAADIADAALAAKQAEEAREAEKDRIAHEKWLRQKGQKDRAVKARAALAAKRAATKAQRGPEEVSVPAVDDHAREAVAPPRSDPVEVPAKRKYTRRSARSGPWSPEEDAALAFLVSIGKLDHEIAAALDRARGSVQTRRLHVLGLSANWKGKRIAAISR